MASPRPVPPRWRVDESSAWENAWNNLGNWSAAMPMPLSRTSKRNAAIPASCPVRATVTAMDPALVNLIALPTRCATIWRNRPASPKRPDGTPGAMPTDKVSPFMVASARAKPAASLTTAWMSSGPSLSSSLPASILEWSRMAAIRSSMALPDWCATSAKRRCSLDKCPCLISSTMPSTPFIGVRSSWLMLARKRDLAMLAASATSFAVSNCRTKRLRIQLTKTSSVTAQMKTPINRPENIQCKRLRSC